MLESNKPLLRGTLHIAAALIAIPAGAYLIKATQLESLHTSLRWYWISLCFLFCTSGLYHTPPWPPKIKQILRRIDHAAIFILIGGSYLPFFAVMGPNVPELIPMTLGFGVVAGVIKSLFAISGARIARVLSYGVVGLIALAMLPSMFAHLPLSTNLLVIGGGALYGIGAFIYARQSPNPWPKTFGFHELFHLFVNLGAACHFTAIWIMTAHVST